MNGAAERALTLLILFGIAYLIYMKAQNKNTKLFNVSGDFKEQDYLRRGR